MLSSVSRDNDNPFCFLLAFILQIWTSGKDLVFDLLIGQHLILFFPLCDKVNAILLIEIFNFKCLLSIIRVRYRLIYLIYDIKVQT